ncbi:MAG: type II secretion system protein [Oscillospiraceae bacterium]|nr:type II secretion system protein [Oscillospiraceae bacterium]
MNENRRNGRKALKGFTLVEIIVVLVILAILAAAMIPALTGYIDKAKERTAIAEARNVLTAAQTLASEEYGLHGAKALDSDWITKTASGDKTYEDKILDLADITPKTSSEGGTTVKYGDITALTFDSGKAKIATLEYTSTGGTKLKYAKNSSGDYEFTVVE